MRRIVQVIGYAFSAIGIILLILWAIRGARPAFDCGLVDAVSTQDWATAYACLDESDYDPLIGILSLVGGVLLAFATRSAPGSYKSKEYNPTPEERQEYRKQLIRRVRSIWIDGYLNQSLYHEVLLSLGMEWNAADPLPTPYGMKTKRQNHTPSLALAAGPQMATFYRQVNHQLLILGAPGAGKTTVMLDLAESYLDLAEEDAAIHIPVIFTLSSWPGKETPFEDWLVSEMRVRYGDDIIDKVARYWLEHNEIALFLDGLDELPEDRRSDAVAAIEAFRNSAIGRWFVVCSRSAEYGALANRFTELDSVEIEPITSAQIQGYLAEVQGEIIQPRIAKLDNTINADTTLQEVADTPLMLNVMLLAADAVEWSMLPTDEGADAVRSVIYDAYIEEMLIRPRTGAQYAAEETLKWLQWLAQKMVEHNQTLFLLERMNRSWFKNKEDSFFWVVTIWLYFAVDYLLLVVLSRQLLVGQDAGSAAEAVSARVGELIWMVLALKVGLRDVEVKEQIRLNFSLNRQRGSLFTGLAAGLAAGIRYGPMMGLISVLIVWLMSELIFVPIAEPNSGLLVRSSSLDQSSRSSQPNYAIRRSLRNGLSFGLIGGLSLGLSFGLFGGLAGGLSFGLFAGLSFGLFGGLICGLSAGLEAVIKHYTLRLNLWLDGSMPLNYVHFLDTCADRILLRKVGGGYMFPHITFRDYFAALTPERINELMQRVEARQEN